MKPKVNRFRLASGLAFACILSSTNAATWVGDSGQDWNHVLNWNGDVAPTGNYTINSASAGVFPVLSTNSSYTPVDVLIGDGASQTGRFDQTAGSLSLANTGTSGNWFIVGRSGGTGTYNLANTSATGGSLTGFGTGTGSLTVGKLWVGGAKFAGVGTGTVNINTSGTITANSTQDFTDTAAPVIVGNASGATGTINLDNGTLQANGNIFVGNGGTGNFNQSGGTVNTTGSLFVGRQVGTTGTGNYVMTGGTVNASAVEVGYGVNNTGAQQGTLTIGTGATLNSTNDFRMGFAGAAASQATVNINGGALNVGSTATKWMIIGQWDTTNSTVNISSGNLNLNANTDIRMKIQNNGGGTNVINLNGGAITSFSDNKTTANGAGVVDLMLSGTSTTNNTFNLNGGTLTIRGVVSTTNNGTRTLNFNGGTLKASGDSTGFVSLGTGSARANVRNGGAVVDSNGFNVTIGQALLHSNIGGDNAIDGGLTKNGTGTLTLTGANTYTGATNVNAGILSVNGLSSTSGVGVASGATFQAQGTIGGTTTLNGGTITNSNSSSATTLGGLSLGASGSIFNLAKTGSAGGLAVSGALSTGGFTATLNASNNLWSIGSNTLISFGSFSGSLSDFNIGSITGLSARQASNGLINTGSAIALDVVGDLPVWSGANSGVWTTAATGDSSGSNNWATKIGNAGTNFWSTDLAEFNDTVNLGAGLVAPSTTTATISGGVSPTSVVFNNSVLDYTVNSSDSTGIQAGSLIKNGSAKLTLNTANTYTGGSTINGGTVSISADANLGGSSSALTINQGTLQTTADLTSTRGVTVGHADSTLLVDAATTHTLNGVVGGSGTLNKTGTGTLVLGGANTYTGGTDVDAGTLRLTTTTGAANSGTFNLNGGTFEVNLGNGNNFGYAPTLNLSTHSTIGNAATGSTSNLNGQINFTGTLNGNGNNLTVSNSGLARLYLNGTLNNVSQIQVQSGAMGFDINSTANRGTAPVSVANGAALWFAGVNATPISNNLTFNGGNGINGGGALYYEGGSATPAALTGSINLASGNTGMGTAFAADTITLNGSVTGSGALTLIKGNAVLSGSNDYMGGTTIASGALTANHGSALGSGTVTVNALAGNQLRLAAGVNVANNLTLQGGGVVAQGILYVPTGDATYSGSINITGAQAAGGHFASGSGTLSVTGAITSSVPVAVRNGTVVVSHTGSAYNSLIVQQGTLRLGANQAIPTAAGVELGLSGAATLDLAGFNQSLAGITKSTNGATITNSGSSDSTLTITGTGTFGGVIQDGATHKTSLTVNGGTFTLTGANTYTGATSVTSGALVVNGSLGNSTTTIGSGGTLGGNGSMGATVISSGATLSPGNSPGELSFTNTLTLEGTTLFEIAGFNRGTEYDGINTTSLLSYGGDLDIVAYDLGAGLWDLTQAAAYDLFAISGGVDGNFDSVTVGGNILTFSSGVWSGVDSGNSNVTYSFSQSTGDLTVSVIPEPGALMLGGLGALLLIRRRRA